MEKSLHTFSAEGSVFPLPKLSPSLLYHFSLNTHFEMSVTNRNSHVSTESGVILEGFLKVILKNHINVLLWDNWREAD